MNTRTLSFTGTFRRQATSAKNARASAIRFANHIARELGFSIKKEPGAICLRRLSPRLWRCTMRCEVADSGEFATIAKELKKCEVKIRIKPRFGGAFDTMSPVLL